MALIAKTGVIGNFRNTFIGSNQKLTNRIQSNLSKKLHRGHLKESTKPPIQRPWL